MNGACVQSMWADFLAFNALPIAAIFGAAFFALSIILAVRNHRMRDALHEWQRKPSATNWRNAIMDNFAITYPEANRIEETAKRLAAIEREPK